MVGNNREHRTFTGFYKGIKVSVTSTGMGCPSTSIAVEELINIGAECLIRIGSTGALQPDLKIGDLLISTGSMKNEGTLVFMFRLFSRSSGFDLTRTLIDTRWNEENLGCNYIMGFVQPMMPLWRDSRMD